MDRWAGDLVLKCLTELYIMCPINFLPIKLWKFSNSFSVINIKSSDTFKQREASNFENIDFFGLVLIWVTIFNVGFFFFNQTNNGVREM